MGHFELIFNIHTRSKMRIYNIYLYMYIYIYVCMYPFWDQTNFPNVGLIETNSGGATVRH